jgi:signal transduction histidine kinase
MTPIQFAAGAARKNLMRQQDLIMSAVRLWQRLTGPTASITDPEARFKAQVLAVTALIAIPMTILAQVAAFLLLRVENFWHLSELHFLLLGALLLGLVYALSRTPHYHLGALLISAQTTLVIFMFTWVTGAAHLDSLYFLILSVLASGVFLSLRATIIISLVNVTGILLVGVAKPPQEIMQLLNPLLFNLMMPPLVFLALYQRAVIEKEREARVQQEQLKAEMLALELEKAHQVNKTRDRFVSLISHEFRTPLAAILSSTEILERYSDRMEAEQRENFYATIKDQVAQLTSIITDVLTLSRLASGQIKLLPTPMDVLALCRDIVAETDAGRGMIRMNRADDESGIGSYVAVDMDGVKAIMRHLLSNAVQYSPDDTPVEVMLTVEAGWLRLSVRDQGIGIPQADHEKVFDPFHRGSNIGTIGGTGLGLSIVQQYVEQMKGRITFESAEGQGTTFHVALPVTQPLAVASRA